MIFIIDNYYFLCYTVYNKKKEDNSMKYYALTFQNGLTFYVKSESILNAVKVSRGVCGKVIAVRNLTEQEYYFRRS